MSTRIAALKALAKDAVDQARRSAFLLRLDVLDAIADGCADRSVELMNVALATETKLQNN